MTSKLKVLSGYAQVFTHLIILINTESRPPDFDLGYPILEPVAWVGYLNWILSTYSDLISGMTYTKHTQEVYQLDFQFL